jgi:hypothetical protein
VRVARRVWAVLLCLGLVTGNAAVCAGWAPTPQARMACCADGGACPMHGGESHAAESARALTQADADSCCASSERERSRPPTPTFAAAISVAVLGTGIMVPASVPVLVLSDDWRVLSPDPPPPVPRHVLLSVFLV